MGEVRAYMATHPESELHRCGKMFGVLVCEEDVVLRAFSAMLDGSYHHPGFVPPVVDLSDPTGYFKQEEAVISKMADEPEARRARSRSLQRWMFAQYRMLSAEGEMRDLIDIFAHQPAILSPEDYFSGKRAGASLPPSGAGECCAPKLLQYAYTHGLHPVAIAEFWMGASPKGELRHEGCYYPACSGKCRPILGHMLRGLEVEEDPTPPVNTDIRILYQDEWLVIVDKPGGLLTTPGKHAQPNAEELMQQRLGDSYLKAVHRLDQDTSGIVVLARDEDTLRRMQRLFATRQVHKRYVARLCATPSNAEGQIALPLIANPLDRPRQMVDYTYGKPALTRYSVREWCEDGTIIVDLYPETGRTHQLRVHCAHPDGLNAPITGDRLYGTSQDSCPLHLRAAEICFVHPVSGDEVHVVSEQLTSSVL